MKKQSQKRPAPQKEINSRRNNCFKDRVLGVVRSIPVGTTMTYAEVAELAHAPGAARAVGTIMSKNNDKTVPCHRVIRSDGKVGDYNRGGPVAKQRLLEQEATI